MNNWEFLLFFTKMKKIYPQNIDLRAETEVEFDDLNSDNTLEESFTNIIQED